MPPVPIVRHISFYQSSIVSSFVKVNTHEPQSNYGTLLKPLQNHSFLSNFGTPVNCTFRSLLCPLCLPRWKCHLFKELLKGEGIYVYFECDDLDKHVEALIEKGVHFEELPNDKPWLWREARLKDPDGNQLILYRAGKNRVNPPWRING